MLIIMIMFLEREEVRVHLNSLKWTSQIFQGLCRTREMMSGLVNKGEGSLNTQGHSCLSVPPLNGSSSARLKESLPQHRLIFVGIIILAALCSQAEIKDSLWNLFFFTKPIASFSYAWIRSTQPQL